MSETRRLLLFVILCLAGLFGRAQVNDAQAWLTAGVEKKLLPGLSVGLEEEVRLEENMTEVGTVYTDLSARYRLNKRFSAAIVYRLTLKRRLDDTYARYHGWYVQGTYREKFAPVILVLRLRYQSRYAEEPASEKASLPKNHFRTRLMVRYDTDRKFEPYLYSEAYFSTGVPAWASFDQLKLCAGVEYTFNRAHSVDLHYLVSREYNVSDPETDFVVGIGYNFKF